ncbi:MAG: flagellar biosynthesis protein FlhF [Paucibacter sp.]|nr:flagellar biosynthesis protein FlhF [Roseateles sp.]
MNVRRFTARTAGEALKLVKQAFGDDAVVLSNKRTADGVEVLAMAPDGMSQIERAAVKAPRTSAPAPEIRAVDFPHAPAARPSSAKSAAAAPSRRSFAERVGLRNAMTGASPRDVGRDVETLAMSTLSFQDYVRERVLKRRKAEIEGGPDPFAPPSLREEPHALDAAGVASLESARRERAAAALRTLQPRRAEPTVAAAPQRPQFVAQPTQQFVEPVMRPAMPQPLPQMAPQMQQPAPQQQQQQPRRAPPVLRDEVRVPTAPAQPAAMAAPVLGESPRSQRDQLDMMRELRQVKGMIEERFSALAFMEKLQRQPVQARLTQRLLEIGFSPALVRKLVESCPTEFKDGMDENAWAAGVLVRNLHAANEGPAIEEQGGVFALIGSTGVGKTTTTAKLAAAFATKYGAANLGLVTLDAYRVGAHEQLRAYGRILGVPVHTAHDRTSLEDLLDLLSAKKLVLVDTAGMAQRDSRTGELLDMLRHPSVKKLLVLNAAQQGETIEDVVHAWRAAQCHGVVLSKIDEAVKLAPALDTLIRHKLTVLGVANGQRVPEDWHRLSAADLVQHALRVTAGSAWRMDSSDVNLVFAGAPVQLASTSIH